MWPGELAKNDHAAHGLWESVHEVVAGACSYCADGFEARTGVERAGVELLDEYKRRSASGRTRRSPEYGPRLVSPPPAPPERPRGG